MSFTVGVEWVFGDDCDYSGGRPPRPSLAESRAGTGVTRTGKNQRDSVEIEVGPLRWGIQRTQWTDRPFDSQTPTGIYLDRPSVHPPVEGRSSRLPCTDHPYPSSEPTSSLTKPSD